MIIDVNHFNQKYQINPKKNMLHESARITKVRSIEFLMPKDFDVLFIPGGVGCIRNLENSSARDEILEAIFDFR